MRKTLGYICRPISRTLNRNKKLYVDIFISKIFLSACSILPDLIFMHAFYNLKLLLLSDISKVKFYSLS